MQMWEAVRDLSHARAATARELQNKFVEEGDTFRLAYGGIDTFFNGLEGLIGPPSPQLSEAMAREHCASVDSVAQFTTGNYGVTTTSEREYWFVVDPEGGLARLGLTSWPVEQKLLAAQLAREELEKEEKKKEKKWHKRGSKAIATATAAMAAATDKKGGMPGGDTAEGAVDETVTDEPGISMRRARPLGGFEAEWSFIDESLEALDQFALRQEEFVGARLYTGPMFVKYNACLRGIGVKAMEPHWTELCSGNRYTTTLHVINSAVVKLGKLQKAEKVYRGVSGGVLPAQFLTPSEGNIQGGCEYGFLSTTTHGDVALEYAAAGGTAGIVFEMQMGMIDRGASLGWLSQYPAEEEILFAPLTGIEIQATRVVGSVLVVEVRLSVNLMNPTIEEVCGPTHARVEYFLLSHPCMRGVLPAHPLKPFQ